MDNFLLLDSSKVIDVDKLQIWPRYGMSIASLLVCSAHNLEAVVQKFVEAGVQLTRINLLSALWPGVDILPYQQNPDGKWDLYNWNPVYFDRLVRIRDMMNEAGIVVQWTNYELYSWSNRKRGPQQENTPWRHNVNGVYWEPEDTTLYKLPDEWSKEWIKKVIPYLNLEWNVFEIGNEFPEKPLHEGVAKLIEPHLLVQVNRNEDTPGQYANMKIGTNYDFIAFHGNKLKYISDLDRPYPREPHYKSFNEFFKKCPHDPKRIIFSSDGARVSNSPVDTYDWDGLREFFQAVMEKGCSIEHQSRAKMTPAPNHDMIEVDWFKSVIAK